VVAQLAAWTAHRTRRVAIRTAMKNQLLGRVIACRTRGDTTPPTPSTYASRAATPD